MNQKLTPNDVYAITALTIDERPNEVIKIIRKNGVMLPNNPTTKQIETAFGSLLTKSEAFRKDFSKLASGYVGQEFSNFTSDELPPPKGVTTSGVNLDAIPKPLTIQPKVGTNTAKKPFSQTAFGSFLSGVFTPETIQGAFNTGLNVWSVKQTGQPASTFSNDINQGRNQLDVNPPTRGTSTTTLVLIGVGAIALIGVAIYFYKKK